MTRDKAKQVLMKSVIERNGSVVNEVAVEDWLNGLEALGLIKFDETCPHKFSMIEAVNHCRSAYIENTKFIKGLEKFGYKIVTV